MVSGSRRDAHERKHIAKEEEEFRVMNRRNRLLGRWAATRMGLSGAEADAYAREVVAADFDQPGEDDVRRKLLDDFSNKGIVVPEDELAGKMSAFLHEARDQIAKENP